MDDGLKTLKVFEILRVWKTKRWTTNGKLKRFQVEMTLKGYNANNGPKNPSAYVAPDGVWKNMNNIKTTNMKQTYKTIDYEGLVRPTEKWKKIEVKKKKSTSQYLRNGFKHN